MKIPVVRLSKVIACGALLLLAGCRIPNLRGPEPAPDLPVDFQGVSTLPSDQAVAPTGVTSSTLESPTTYQGATSSQNAAELGVEEFFNDPVLAGLIHQALAGNRELKILNEEVQIARNEITARRGAYLPFVTFGAGASLEKPSRFTPEGAVEEQLEPFPGKEFPDPLPDFKTSFNLFWAVDIWRELRNARDAAIQRYFAACERRNYFVTQLIAEVAEDYYELLALDKRLETLDQTIALQEQSLEISKAKKEAGRDTELPVQRFEAEVRKNQSEKLVIRQQIVEAENRINARLNRYPQPVERMTTGFLDLNVAMLGVGVPPQLLQNRADIRQAEREVAAAGLDVLVARAHFFPKVDITAGAGYRAFDTKFLFHSPDSLIYGVAGDLVAPVINRKAIKAEYCSANAEQLRVIYNYQRTTLNAFTEVINRVSKVQNYSESIEVKKQQLAALEASVDTATKLFQNARAEYVEVLLAQRDLNEARIGLIELKQQQLSAIVNAYQALGGGYVLANSTVWDCLVVDGSQSQLSPAHIAAEEGPSRKTRNLPLLSEVALKPGL